MWAAEAGKSDIILTALDTSKVDINKVTNGKPLLYLVSYRFDLQFFQRLLSLGADTGIKCNSV